MTDIHTHLLPCMDDGSSSPEESRQIIAELIKQGVTNIAATPHFYSENEAPEEFFRRRDAAYSQLEQILTPDVKIFKGAEVLYYPGISRTEALPEFAIGDTKLLLLEMPFCDWSRSVVNEVFSIQRDRKLNVVIAHIDRYASKRNAEHIFDMSDFGILFQINANAFLDKKRRAEALHMLENRAVHFVASDCHNMDLRPPRLGEAYDMIRKKLGNEYSEWLDYISNMYFENNGV